MSRLTCGFAFGFVLATVAWTAAPARAETTAYDSLGRVISVITDDGKQTLYAYDAAGNRTTVSTTGSTTAQPPVAVDDPISYTYGAAAPTFDPRVNDSDPGHLALTIVGVAPPRFGAASFTGTSVTYTPSATHVGGVDAFAYTIRNTANLTASALVKVTLINPAPIANPYAVTVGENAAASFDPRVGDSDPGGLTFTITAVTAPAHGGALINGGTSITYTPANGYWGPDGFNYTITNTAGASASAAINATVTALPPIANPYALITSPNTAATFDPRVNDSDPNFLPLTITAIGAPSHGTAAINAGVSVTYTPTSGYTGADAFSYAIANSGGGAASSTVNVTVQTPGPLSASASAATWDWSKVGTDPPTIDPADVTTPSGGQWPYSYAWQYVSGDAAMSATAPTSASTQWTRTMTSQTTHISVWRCQVTDGLGAVAYTGNVTVTFSWGNQ